MPNITYPLPSSSYRSWRGRTAALFGDRGPDAQAAARDPSRVQWPALARPTFVRAVAAERRALRRIGFGRDLRAPVRRGSPDE